MRDRKVPKEPKRWSNARGCCLLHCKGQPDPTLCNTAAASVLHLALWRRACSKDLQKQHTVQY